MELGPPETHPFVFTEATGWKCPCGAVQKKPAPAKGATTPIFKMTVMSDTHWVDNVKVVRIVCLLCGRTAHSSRAHNLIDEEGLAKR